MYCNNILEAVGRTPLVRLNRLPVPGSAEVLVKFEAVNVGGSIKTRTALNMVQDAMARGLIGPDTVIVEPTSGNQGVGLALVGAVLVEGLLTDGQATGRYAKATLTRFRERCGATVCKDLKGVETGKVLCPCNECVRSAVLAAGEALGEN